MFVPTIGRIVHVANPEYPEIDCRAGIVSGLDYGAGKTTTLHVSVMNPHHAAQPVTNAALTDPAHWHDPRECPRTPALDREIDRALGNV